jgi:hypothetical protein
MAENAFQVFQGRQNARVVQLLEKNHDISGAISGLLTQLVEMCDQKGVDFEEITLRDVFISESGHLGGQIMLK